MNNHETKTNSAYFMIVSSVLFQGGTRVDFVSSYSQTTVMGQTVS